MALNFLLRLIIARCANRNATCVDKKAIKIWNCCKLESKPTHAINHTIEIVLTSCFYLNLWFCVAISKVESFIILASCSWSVTCGLRSPISLRLYLLPGVPNLGNMKPTLRCTSAYLRGCI